MIANVTVPDVLGGILAAIIFIPFLLWSCVMGWRVGGQAGQAITYQVPSPQQITEQLRIDLGREPNLTEVAAVHQMLTADHNQQLIGAAAVLGAAYLITHEHH